MKLLNNKTFKEIFFSHKGRISADELWIYSLGIDILSILSGIITGFISWKLSGGYNNLGVISITNDLLIGLFGFIDLGILILCFYTNIMLLIKRAHDLGKDGNWLFFLLIPLYNLVILFKLGFIKGQEYNNIYGEYDDCKISSKGILILIVEFVLVFGWNLGSDYITQFYRDIPLEEFNEWINENPRIGQLLSNDKFYNNAQKVIKKIADDKLGCDCFGEYATETPDRDLDANFWRELYSEFEAKLIEYVNAKDNQSEE